MTLPQYVRVAGIDYDAVELVNIYHGPARTALSGSDDQSKYARRVWAAGAYVREHLEATTAGAYKALERALA